MDGRTNGRPRLFHLSLSGKGAIDVLGYNMGATFMQCSDAETGLSLFALLVQPASLDLSHLCITAPGHRSQCYDSLECVVTL